MSSCCLLPVCSAFGLWLEYVGPNSVAAVAVFQTTATGENSASLSQHICRQFADRTTRLISGSFVICSRIYHNNIILLQFCRRHYCYEHNDTLQIPSFTFHDSIIMLYEFFQILSIAPLDATSLCVIYYEFTRLL